MKKYTLAFIFDEHLKKVLLIRKTKPEEQAGKLNGIGGKLEDSDIDLVDCIKREVYEETKLSFPREVFSRVGELTDNENYYVAIFTVKTTGALLNMAATTTDEEVVLFQLEDLYKENFTNQTPEIIDTCLKLWKSHIH